MLKERDAEVQLQIFSAQHDVVVKERRDRKVCERLYCIGHEKEMDCLFSKLLKFRI